MNGILSALLPVFLVTLAGVVLKRMQFLPLEGWSAIDKLCYFVLFPAIIFKEIASADFAGVPVAGMAAALMLAIGSMSIALLIVRPLLSPALGIDGPAFTSIFQGATRWNALIALAIIPLAFGNDALALGAVGVAAMIPLLNLINVGVLSLYGSGRAATGSEVLRQLATNPYVISSVGGVLWKAAGLPLPAMAGTSLDLLGKGALGLALLAVGAGLTVPDGSSGRISAIIATILKLLVMPTIVAVWLRLLGVTGDAASVAILCSAVPSAAGAYVLASRMGGDAPLMAQIVTLQTICAALTLPLVLGFLA
jgi:predicted permease